MDNLLELLLSIEKRPKLFLGRKDLKALRNFLDGYCLAKREQESEYGAWLYEDFRLWLVEKYQDPRSLGWDGLIEVHEDGENKFDMFFHLLHGFLERS